MAYNIELKPQLSSDIGVLHAISVMAKFFCIFSFSPEMHRPMADKDETYVSAV